MNATKRIRKKIQIIVERLQPDNLERNTKEDITRNMIEMSIPERRRAEVLLRIDMKKLIKDRRKYLESIKKNYLELLGIMDDERISRRDKEHIEKNLN